LAKTKMTPPPVQTEVVQSAPVTSFAFDIFRGAVLGDWDHTLRVPGAVTQAIMGFIPVVGDICAVRDGIHDLVHRDALGVALNILALVPVFGGIPKTIEVIRSTRHIQQAYVRSHRKQPELSLVMPPKPSRSGIFSSWVTFLFGFASFVAGLSAALITYGYIPGWSSGAARAVWLLGALPLALLSLIFSLRGRLAKGHRGLVRFGVFFALVVLAGIAYTVLVDQGNLPALSLPLQ
jgi:hypothetical protein